MKGVLCKFNHNLRNSEQSVRCEYRRGTLSVLIITDKRMEPSKSSSPHWDYRDLDAKVNIQISITNL